MKGTDRRREGGDPKLLEDGAGRDPEVSVIVPVYNAEKTLERCVDSILAQDYRDFELLLVDDGSTDRSAEICEHYAEADGRVRVTHQENAGVSETRNRALDSARGRYIQFLDADDWIVPEATGLFVRAAEESGAELVVSDFYRVVRSWTAHKGSIDEEGILSREEFADWMLKSPADYYYGVLWNKLYRRSIIERFRLRMDGKLKWCEDFIFNMEYILHVSRVFVLRVPTYYYVKTEGSLVSQAMKLGSIVRMKLNVIEYYLNFYRNIYSEEDYASKRPEIYRFLLDYSHDAAVLPLLPGSEKLGEERVVAVHEPGVSDLWLYSYYENRMFRRVLTRAAEKLELDYRDLCVMIFLHHFGTVENQRELAEFLGLPQVAATALIQRLALKGFLKMELGKPETAALTEASGAILQELGLSVEEVWRAGVEGMTEEEEESYRRFRERVYRNLRVKLER